ncbi:MAG: hypothetical protein KF709_07955 [Gemmatimonadaceae bacterium]|nr:hypothetical protein [Gemmatimonadaceae bacterium]
MGQLTVKQYDALERAIVDQRRITVMRRGTEYTVIPERLALIKGREAITARHPSTGAALTLYLDEADSLEVVK